MAAQLQAKAQTPVLQITSQSEGERLWKHALFGAGAHVNMIEGYYRLEMPGVPIEALQALVTRLQQVLKRVEVGDEVPSNPQRLTVDAGGPMAQSVTIEPSIETLKPKSERRKPRQQDTAQEERPGDPPLSAEVGDERDAE